MAGMSGCGGGRHDFRRRYDAWWWPYVFILIGGALATDIWRFLGVYLAGGIAEDSDILVLVRCVATALVAAVIANTESSFPPARLPIRRQR